MLRFERNPAPGLGWAIGLGLLGVFLLDCFTALGYAEWVLFLLPVLLSQFLWRPAFVVLVTVAACVLLIGGFAASPDGISLSMAIVNRSLGLLTILCVGAVCHQSVRRKLTERRQEWLQEGQVSLSRTMSGEQTLESVAINVLTFFSQYINASAGLLYVRTGHYFQLVGSYAIPTGCVPPPTLEPGQGLAGQAISEARSFKLKGVAPDYLRIGSSLGSMAPCDILITPIQTDDTVVGVLELAFAEPSYGTDLDLLERVTSSIGMAIKACIYLKRQRELLEETTRQSEELQAQSEELRVNNEELEEQSRALRDTQARLELQQAELEQTNAQLEEQTALLETQRNDLVRAKTILETQKVHLERSSQYKSEFLANMSHELRTPLNSSLILSKLLADNKSGNLSAEQVKYAQTIYDAGNDLLALINDILDLAKIESGKLDICPEPVWLEALVDGLQKTFEPIAAQKGVRLRVEIPTATRQLESDNTRLSQILRNLLSNAFKFTERGEVVLAVSETDNESVTFTVRDTGIGIPADQQEVIFEAFRQADGTTNRKFGGTGLGLSISRELTRLLGGHLRLHSQLGEGTTFELTLPKKIRTPTASPIASPTASDDSSDLRHALAAYPDASQAHVRGHASDAVSGQHFSVRPIAGTQSAGAAGASDDHSAMEGRRAEDDRSQLRSDLRTILVIEDDAVFSSILADLARQQNFNCLLAGTANEGLQLAARFAPSAIVLDLGLPDQSGLSVLDRLKHDVRTRHIPVHIISATDYTEAALSLGAIGYMLKPVKREQLEQAFEDLQQRLSTAVRRVLVVEDDEVQLESLQKLLGTPDVEVVGVSSAIACLEQLKDSTFDCMVLDLSLPDATGFSLLETLSREDRYSFPPVIVYTGRELSAEQEQSLRRYSRSIIIKGARSPERLLDEVTLFLHQVVQELPPAHQEMLRRAQDRDSQLEGRRVLVVEDDVRNVFAITSILEPKGILVEIARNGKEALTALQKDDPTSIELVLMDLMMPEMDGLTAIREIRKNRQWARLPIIALTAKAMKNDQQMCLDAGANDYMAKPLDVERLISLIRVWLPRS